MALRRLGEEEMKTAITSGLIIGMAVALLYNFIMIATYGEVVIKELNTFILRVEIVLMAGIVCYGIYLIKGEIKYWLLKLDYWIGRVLFGDG